MAPRKLLVFVCAASALTAAQVERKAAPPATPRQIAQAWLQSLTLRERVAQLVMIPCYGDVPPARSKAWQEYVRLVRDVRVGGLIVLNRVQSGVVQNAEPYQMAVFLNRMQRLARIPLLVGADFERGASMRVAGTAKFPHAMAFGAAGDLEATRALGQATAREARALGVHWIFAPVADVNNNPDNPIINIRSFGEDPRAVANHVRAFIEGAHAPGGTRVLTTLKHFPGHGDTAVDSHLGLARNDAPLDRLESVELLPFREGIAAGADSVMSAHMAVPALESEEIPATVSSAILTRLLREKLKFQGITVTDAMDMQGLAKQFSPGEAAVRSLLAGADLLLIPPKPEEAINAVVAAVQSKRLDRRRIDESALKVLLAKAQAGLARHRYVNIENLSDALESPEAEQLAQSVAERAVTALRNEGSLLPLSEPARACYFVLFENRYSVTGRRFVEALRQRAPKARSFLLDPDRSEAAIAETVKEAAGCPVAVVATFVTPSAYRGTAALSGSYPALMDRLLQNPAPVVMVSLGNPYLLRTYPKVAAYLTTFSNSAPSEIAAVKALFGEIPVAGKSPVSIPGIAPIGAGLQIR